MNRIRPPTRAPDADSACGSTPQPVGDRGRRGCATASEPGALSQECAHAGGSRMNARWWTTVAAAVVACGCGDGDAATAADAATGKAGTDAVAADAGGDAVAATDAKAAKPDAAKDVPPTPLTKGIWTQLAVPADPNVSLHGVWADGPLRAVAVGSNGTILENNGLGWKIASQGKFPTLHAVAGAKGGSRTFAVGLGGTIVQAEGAVGGLGAQWGPAGGCAKPSDCNDGDPCTADSCDGGVCSYLPSGAAGCCGAIHFADAFDKGIGNWAVVDTKNAPEGGIVWKAASLQGKDGSKRATSPPNAAYFGLVDVPCADGGGFCGTFDNGKTVGSTMQSPPIKLPKAQKITLSFQLLAEIDSGFPDQLRVWVVTAAGSKEAVWDKEKVIPTGNTQGKFAPQAIELTKWAGQQVRIEVAFDSITKNSNSGEGVFIDDVVVASECGPPASGTKALTKGTLFGVWAASDDDAWAVGEAGFTTHWDGAVWAAVTGGKARDVWGMGGAGAKGFAVGDLGLLATIEAGGFKMANSGADKLLRAVAAHGDGAGGIIQAVAVGTQGTVAALGKGGWALEPAPALAGQELSGIAAFADGSFAATTLSGGIWMRYEPGVWKQQPIAGLPLKAIAASGSDSAWAVGQLGALVERQGGAWKTGPKLPGGGNANAVWCHSHDACMAVGDGGKAWRRQGGVWTDQFTATSVNLQAVWGASPNAVFAVGLLSSIVMFDGQDWLPLSAPPGIDFRAVWGTSETDVWAGGSNGAVAHWNGSEWQLMVEPVSHTLRAVWGLSGTDLWAVGDKGAIYHGNGAGWKRTEIEPFQPDPEQKPYKVESPLLAVWGAAADDVWASGEPDWQNHGVLVHWDGKTWKYVPLLYDLPRTIRAMWGKGQSDILLCGTQGTVMQFDGKEGKIGLLEVPTIATLFALSPWGKDILFAGDIGTVLRYSPPPPPPK